MFRSKFFATAAAYVVTVYASLSISNAIASNEDLVWEIIEASGMVEGMEVAASEGLKAGIAPIAQQLEPLGECGVPVIKALEADIASLMTVLTDKALEFYRSPVGIKLKELAPEFALAGVETTQTDVMSSFQAKIQETLVTKVAEAQQCMVGRS